MSDDLSRRIDALTPDLVALRHDIHRHPETAYEEHRTAGLVASRLGDWGIAHATGIGVTGVVATIRAGSSPRAIVLRADLDALDVHERASHDHVSRIPGKMHACGHDGHTAMLLGAARLLATRARFDGAVHLVFQPAEEGRAGAKRMIEDGLFERFPAEAAYGLHNMAGLPVGRLFTRAGPITAASDRFVVTISGMGGHGGFPHRARDPITASGAFLAQVQTLAARRIRPGELAVISVGHIAAGHKDALNVIPDDVVIGGTVRTYSATLRDEIEAAIGALAEGCARAHGLTAKLDYRRGYPSTVNHPDAVAIAARAAKAALGPAALIDDLPPYAAGDDFAYFAERVPSCFVFLGNGPGEGDCYHHNPRYDFNDAIIPQGVRFWVELVETALPRRV
jgi:hippurate hydrolase